MPFAGATIQDKNGNRNGCRLGFANRKGSFCIATARALCRKGAVDARHVALSMLPESLVNGLYSNQRDLCAPNKTVRRHRCWTMPLQSCPSSRAARRPPSLRYLKDCTILNKPVGNILPNPRGCKPSCEALTNQCWNQPSISAPNSYFQLPCTQNKNLTCSPKQAPPRHAQQPSMQLPSAVRRCGTLGHS